MGGGGQLTSSKGGTRRNYLTGKSAKVLGGCWQERRGAEKGSQVRRGTLCVGGK